ncbi:hypothetical protein [Botrimarina colliarenosi]|uniref:hypothetical protein n=1 Tax=Botrimarina colliarenosi TaxID=2528001 RepID=UPI0011B53976|nr:hypothetical protein [Botrimarina colliarenosi]
MSSATADLSSVLPLGGIQTYFGGTVERTELPISQLDIIMSECQSAMFLLATNCAIRAKQLVKQNLDLSPLVPYLEKRDPRVIHKFEELIDDEAIRDIYACRCTFDNELVASILLAHVFPNDLYIGHVEFADPSQPIPIHQRKSVMQTHRGLGLLSPFMERVDLCAQHRFCDRITLVANETSQQHLFERYGFSVDDYPAAKQQESEGKLIPMHKTVR